MSKDFSYRIIGPWLGRHGAQLLFSVRNRLFEDLDGGGGVPHFLLVINIFLPGDVCPNMTHRKRRLCFSHITLSLYS